MVHYNVFGKLAERLDTACKILELSLSGNSRTNLYRISKLYLDLSREQVDSYLSFLSEMSFAHVTEDCCEVTYAGAKFIQKFPEFENFLKADPYEDYDSIVNKIISSD